MSVLVALVLDRLLGEPPDRAHPVVGMGWLLDRLATHVPAAPPRSARRAGAAAWLLGLGAVTAAATATDRAVRRLPRPLAAASRGVVLWTLLAVRGLLEEVDSVEAALRARDLPLARQRLSRIVSRDTAALSPAEVRQAAIESLAENASDAAIAPLVWASIGGLPAAAAYRYVNTADACWGYRDDRWRHAGWAAARADDVANLLPARLTGLLLAGRRVPWRRLREEARRTTSPNAGWPMAAVALRSGVRLAKPGVYVLHAGGRTAAAADADAIRDRVIATVAAVAAVAAIRELCIDQGHRPCLR